MEKKQTFKVLTLISSIYQKKFEFGENKDDDKMTVNAWHRYLSSYQYEIVQSVVDKIILNKPEWPPTVGEVVREIEDLKAGDKLLPGAAWDKVLKAIRLYGALYGIQKAMNSLDQRTKLAVRGVGGLTAIAKANDNELNFLKNDFKKEYKAITDKEVKENYLPVGLKKKFKQLQDNLDLLEGAENAD